MATTYEKHQEYAPLFAYLCFALYCVGNVIFIT